MPDGDWSAKAKQNADYHVEAQRRAKEQEAVRGRELIAAFVVAARERGLPERDLTVRPYKGGGRYRTGLRGWYLLPDQSIGVDAEANFYVLSAPPSLAARIRGMTLPPTPAPMRVGERDGESMNLGDLLTKRLGAGADHA